MKKEKIMGFDIGNYRLKIVLRQAGGPPRLISEKIPEGMVKDGKTVSWNAMGDFIAEVLQEHQIKCRDAAVSLPQDACFVRNLKMPKMTVSQLKINLPYEFHDYISDEMDQYVYDYSVQGRAEKELRLLAAAARKDMLEKYEEMFRRAKLRLILAAPEICGFENLIARHEKMSGIRPGSRDYAVLDLGHRYLRIHFFRKGIYDVSRSMEPGCSAFAEHIADATGKDVRIAQIASEQNYDQSMNREQIADIYNQMAVKIMRVLNFYSYNNPENNIDTVYYCGGGARNTDLLNEIHQTAGMPLMDLAKKMYGIQGEQYGLTFSPQAYGITFGKEDIENGSERSFE